MNYGIIVKVTRTMGKMIWSYVFFGIGVLAIAGALTNGIVRVETPEDEKARRRDWVKASSQLAIACFVAAAASKYIFK